MCKMTKKNLENLSYAGAFDEIESNRNVVYSSVDILSNISSSAEKAKSDNQENEYGSELGRFPANLIHDGSDEVKDLLPNVGSGNNFQKYNYNEKEYDNKEDYKLQYISGATITSDGLNEFKKRDLNKYKSILEKVR